MSSWSDSAFEGKIWQILLTFGSKQTCDAAKLLENAWKRQSRELTMEWKIIIAKNKIMGISNP